MHLLPVMGHRLKAPGQMDTRIHRHVPSPAGVFDNQTTSLHVRVR